jgi:hypothetical protein
MRYRVKIRVDVPCRFTIAISWLWKIRRRFYWNASEQIQELAKDILFGQLRFSYCNNDNWRNQLWYKFLENISKNVDSELKKID